jgi:GH43 family beta-xylosidase
VTINKNGVVDFKVFTQSTGGTEIKQTTLTTTATTFYFKIRNEIIYTISTPIPPTPIPGWNIAVGKHLLNYSITCDGTTSLSNVYWVNVSSVNDAAIAADSVTGCTAFVYDKTNNRCCLKSPNFKNGENFETKTGHTFDTLNQNIHTYYRSIENTNKKSFRVQTGFKNADPSVLIYKNVYLYVYANSSGGDLYIASNVDLTKGVPNNNTLVNPSPNMFNKFVYTIGNLKTIKSSVNVNYCPSNKTHHLWAPEIVNVNGTLCIFFSFYTSATDSTVYCMKIKDETNITKLIGWNTPTKINFGSSIMNNNWYIDPALFEYNGKWYIVVSANIANTIAISAKKVEQRLLMQEFNTTTFQPTGTPTVLGSPKERNWEYIGTAAYYPNIKDYTGNQDNFGIEEGPFMLKYNGQLYLLFNGNFSMHPGYCIGAYKFLGGNILDATRWQKTQYPLFISTPYSHPGNLYGIGAPTITQSNGKYFMFYHGSPINRQYENRLVFVTEIDPSTIDKYNTIGGSVSSDNFTIGSYLGGQFVC